MKKVFVTALLTAFAVLCSAQGKENGLIFSADFDDLTAKAGFAAGKPENGGLNADLSARKFPGAAGKGNAVCLKATERITWNAEKNFNPKQGTVSFWIAPQNWVYTKKGLTTFFETRFGDYLFAIYEENNYGTFAFVICTFKPRYREVGQVRVRMTAKEWPMGKWHKIDAVWNENMMAVYLDGVLAKKPCNFSKPAEFPAANPRRAMQLGWGHRTLQDTTAFDDFKIYNRVLSADEIKQAYTNVFPAKK